VNPTSNGELFHKPKASQSQKSSCAFSVLYSAQSTIDFCNGEM